MQNKDNLVREIFSSVATKYDLMNNLMSAGVHHLWKKSLLEMMPNNKAHLLDVASGTGDVARAFYKKAKQSGITPKVTISDVNIDMLEVGREKFINQNILDIEYVHCNAEELPFESNKFDYYTISYGIRNVTNIDKVLSEAYRVLKPGGKFMCLEFSKVESELFSKLYENYSKIIPLMGEIVARDRDSYQYLVDSIKAFPPQETFLTMIKNANFVKSGYVNLTKGVSAIHFGYKV